MEPSLTGGSFGHVGLARLLEVHQRAGYQPARRQGMGVSIKGGSPKMAGL